MKWLIAAIVIGVLAGGGWYYWHRQQATKEQKPTLTTAKVERGAIRVTVAATGRVQANLDVDIKCKASGEIIKLPFDVSDTVKKDELLLELDPVDQQRVLKQAEVALSSSQAKLASARENLKLAELGLATDRQRAAVAIAAAKARADDATAKAERMRQLLEKKLTSKEDFDTADTSAVAAKHDLDAANIRLPELQAQEQALELKRQDIKLAEAQVAADQISRSVAQDRLADTRVVAPLDGVISARNVQIGQIISSATSNVSGGTTVLTLSDLSRLFVSAAVDESDIGRVKVGQRVDVTADAYRNQRFGGQVVQIATKGVNTSNVITFEVKIEVVSEQRELLKPEMTTNVEIVCEERVGTLTVPTEAITRRQGQTSVQVVKGEGVTEPRAVTVGLSDGTRVEVTAGLAEGDLVVLHKAVVDSRWNASSRSGPPPMF